jgi:Raf kinase inhibitor-like YbhB/YbcL family protein
MKFAITSFEDGAAIPGKYAFCVPGEPVAMSDNISPAMTWSELPEGTKSLALICHDPDVPSVGDDVNQEGKSVSATLPRVEFFHLVLVNISADLQGFEEGALSKEVTARGKAPGKTEFGVQGINDYTGWFKGDAEMEGDYGGYDGPCPPWNDELVHRYVFTLYALDVESVALSGSFTGQQAEEAIQEHIIEQATWSGTYTLNKSILEAGK